MAYDLGLVERIRSILSQLPGVKEKKMFGGVGFLLQGNMACGVHGQDLIVRVGGERYLDVLSRPHTKPFDMTGRPMSGWVVVTQEGYESLDLYASGYGRGLILPAGFRRSDISGRCRLERSIYGYGRY